MFIIMDLGDMEVMKIGELKMLVININLSTLIIYKNGKYYKYQIFIGI